MIKTLAKCIGKYKKESIITPIFTAVEVFLEILIPFITASIIDKGIQAGDMRKVGIYGGIMLIIAFLSLFCGIQAGKYGAAASTGFACNLREKMYENIQTFSFSNIDKFSTAGLVTRMTTDVTNVQNAYQMIIRSVVRAPLMMICSITMCVIISPRLSIIFLVALIFLGFLSLNKSFTQPVTQISQQVSSIVMAMAGAGRVFDLCDEVPETDEGDVELVNICYDSNGEIHETEELTEMWAWKKPNAANKDEMYTRLQGDVTFDGVDFGYNPDKIVLHDIKMFAKPGQKLAFVGSTGAGKTTITNLINRFYDIQDGKIRYDGININHIKKDDLRRSLGIVLQDTNLFTGTIMDNIRYGRLNAADEECIAAAKLANADGFIKRLPDGYNTVLTGGGANLSQGQRQLLAIARAAVADPPVLILDEATSSIDTRTEKLVQRGMDALMTGRTSFVIAHRLSTVRNADCIMVMEQGRIIERGTHDQLMEEKGRYYQLYTGKSISA